MSNGKATAMAEIMWRPDPGRAAATDLAAFVRGARADGPALEPLAIDPLDYAALWQWSVDDIGRFWQRVWDFYAVHSDTDPGPALATDAMPGARWFPDAQINYVDQVLRHGAATPDAVAILDLAEDAAATPITWAELVARVGALAATLRAHGVSPGDRVVGYLPNIPEAMIAFLATASLGAVWAACGQDYSAPAAVDRLGQLTPTVLITADGYRFGGRDHDRRAEAARVRDGLPGLALVITVDRLGDAATGPAPDGAGITVTWTQAVAGDHPVEPVRVGFDHPLWVVFSSGTTGLPKGIVHGHGGVLLEHLKAVGLQSDLRPGDVFFWFTSPSWMMWNFQVGGLLVGATVVTYDGSPTAPQTDGLWELAARHRVNLLGTSPGYVLACAKAGVVPREDHDLSALRTVGVTGAALPAESGRWLRDNVGEQVQTASISGGTDVVTAFIGAAPTVPVWAGELSCRYLGAALAAYDQAGREVIGEVGELVITRPMPSMPVQFWNDPDGTRYREAYFADIPGVWRHGDWITVTARGSVEVHGRSDSTLNRNGIRMGSADIYQVVEALPEIAEALVLGIEHGDGDYWMPLFVVLREGAELDEALTGRIREAIRTQASPRHVPDEVIAAPGIPHTRTGKKLEVPLKRLMLGADPATAVDATAVDRPDLLDWYARHRPR